MLCDTRLLTLASKAAMQFVVPPLPSSHISVGDSRPPLMLTTARLLALANDCASLRIQSSPQHHHTLLLVMLIVLFGSQFHTLTGMMLTPLATPLLTPPMTEATEVPCAIFS